MSKTKVAMVLGIVCMILVYAIGIQLKTIESIGQSSEINFANNELRDEVLRLKERYDSLYREFDKAQIELESIRKQATQNNEDSLNLEDQLQKNQTLLGLTDVSGKGVIITIKDNSNVTLESLKESLNNTASNYIVHDEDLRMIVNELKNAGAEAISINDERIVSTTSITCIGTVIQVNNKRLNSPYVIKAIGNPESLYSVDRLGGYIDYYIKPYVEFSMKKDHAIEIQKYTGLFTNKYMKTK